VPLRSANAGGAAVVCGLQSMVRNDSA
jgi:hypothetical protein